MWNYQTRRPAVVQTTSAQGRAPVRSGKALMDLLLYAITSPREISQASTPAKYATSACGSKNPIFASYREVNGWLRIPCNRGKKKCSFCPIREKSIPPKARPTPTKNHSRPCAAPVAKAKAPVSRSMSKSERTKSVKLQKTCHDSQNYFSLILFQWHFSL